jgi:alpha-1,2-mannosyltransferase
VAVWPSWAVSALGVLAWAAALAAVAPLVRGYLTNAPDQRMVDLAVYRTGGLSVLQGQPLYTMLTQPPQLLPFTYPPVAALFAVPLALMPWSAAQLVWVPFIYGPLAVVIWFAFAPLLRRAGRLRAVLFAVVFAACAYLFPLRDEMRFGQVDMVLLAMSVADCAAIAPRWPRGALVGLATAIKLIPGVFIVYLWLSGRRRAAVTAAVAALAWTVGAWLVLPRDSVTYWTSVIFQSGRLGSNSGTSNQSLRGMLLREFLPGQAPGAVWAAVALAVAVAGFALARRLARQSREMEGIAVTALLGVLLSPVSWIHHFLVVVVVIGAILADGRSGRRVAIAAGTAIFFALTIPWWGQTLLGAHDVPALAARIVEDAFGIAALALLVILAALRDPGPRSVELSFSAGTGFARPAHPRDAGIMWAMLYAYLGPEGTFSEAALRAADPAAEPLSCPTIQAALGCVRDGTAERAVVPIESSVEGVVTATLDDLAVGNDLVIVAELQIPIAFALLARPGTNVSDIKKVGGHAVAMPQCRGWLAAHLPHGEWVPLASNAEAARQAADGQVDAALAGAFAADRYGLAVLVPDVHDRANAVTRFVVVSAPRPLPARTGADRTSLAAFLAEDHPGALLEILTEFAVRGINLTTIQSRPTGDRLGQYYFFIDCEGHVDDARVGEALMGLRRVCQDVRFLGSYARCDGPATAIRPGTSDAEFAEAAAWLGRLRFGRP